MLPVKSTAFAEQPWPGKQTKEEDGSPRKAEENKAQAKRPDMSEQEQKFYDQLVQEMEVERSFQNNDGKPDGDLKLLDKDALEQLESRLSVEDQWVLYLASV